MDEDAATFSNTLGLRSPGGPTRGRSIKDIEEQLSNLKKENFNLKLRIYFLEEKMGTNFTLDKDNIVKKNIELQIEIANLQKEVDNKHELLCQAVRAMELEDEEHKKYISGKEDQLNMYQQELEDLRMQLQDTKFDSDGVSLKSETAGFYSSRAMNVGTSFSELQEKVKLLEAELNLEKENNASLQFVINQTETLRSRYENMQKESQAKEETIKSLHQEIEAANDKIMSFTDQMKEFQEKIEAHYKENQILTKKLQMENKRFEDVQSQMAEIRRKYAMARAEVEREQKKVERIKIMNDMKVSELEEENQKQKVKIRDLQSKLDTALVEIKKNQNLAVFKSPAQKSITSNTDIPSLSVPNPAAPFGAAQKDALHVQISPPVKNSSVPSSPLSPEKFEVSDLERMLQGAAGNDEILSHFQILKKENAHHSKKIIKLKSEQMKACEIIKNMMESRNKANDEISKLKAHIKELEHELESVVTKPACEGDGIPLKQRVAQMNIKAVTSEDERSMAESREEPDVLEHYKSLTAELETRAELLVALMDQKDAQAQKMRDQFEEMLTTLQEKENRIVDLEFELVSVQESGKDVDRSLLEKRDSPSEKHSSFYRQEIQEKDHEIERLTVELKKCSCYLQEIVNKELWEKNKEIEKLYKKQANSSEVMKLRKDLAGKEQQLKILTEKISELGLDITIPSEALFDTKELLLSSSNNSNSIRLLQDQLKSCKEERNYLKKEETDVEMRQNVSKLFGTPPKCNTTSTTLKYQSEGQSESEGWSEPDRVVSRARIGLSQTLPTEQNNKDRVVESTEEDVRHSTTPTKRSHEKRQSFSDLHQQITDLQEELRSKTDQLKKSEEKLIRLTELEMKLKETEARLSESEAKQRETENTAEALRRLIEDIENSKQELQESIVTKDKETQDKMNLLEIDKSNANKLAQQFENEALRNKQMLQEFETRLKQIQAEKAKVEEEVRKEYEQFAVSKLKEAEKEFLTKLRKVEEKAEERIKNIKEEYDRDYMRKSDIECRLNEINKLQTELSDLKNVVQSYEETIEFYRNRETEFTRKGQGYQEKIVHLRRELDNTTLQYSEAVLEKSKLTNEKTSLEQQLSHNSIKVSELKQQTNDIKLELEKVGLDYQQQVSSLHIQKSKLEVKVSELESTNADLYNKLVRLQASRTEFSTSLPNFSGRIIPVVPYKRQFSDQPYTSEDNIEERAFVHSAIQNLQQVDMERQEANSSPDLGIDSDHGRFSSLETHTTIPRPLLQTLELTESMNNLLSGDSGPLESVSCESDHCCQRTLEISHENNDLKRKIQNMRRALDETLNQLNLANQQKKQVEKNICRQIHKTSQVLRKAKANLDSGSESDVFK